MNKKLIRKMQTASGGPLFPWQLNTEWINDWKFRTTPASRSRVLSGKGVETDKQYTERRKKETTKRTWRSDAADIAHGIGEGVLALHPYTAIPYFGAKVGLDFLNGTYGWQTALNASVPLFHLAPQAVGLREATNVALEDAANAGSKTARNWRVAREIKQATKNTKLDNNSTVIPHEDLFDFWHGGLESDFDFKNLDVFRKASKQSKRNRNYAGFYMYSTPRLLGAFNYGFGEAHGIKLKPDAKKLKVNFNTERIEALELLNYRNQGYDYIEGKDVWGAPEYILLNKDAIQHTGFFDHSLGHNIHILRDRNVPKADLSMNNLPSKTSLAFFERKPSKISEAERAGVPKGERNIKQGYLLKDAIEEANKFAEKWGYDKLSQNATLLDIENLYNQHNTFFRGVTTEQLENTRNRVAKELGVNPELLTNDLYLLYVSTHPWPGNDRIWVTPFSHYGKIYGNADMIGGKGLVSAVMRPWKTTKDIKQWPKLSLWTLGFKEDVSNPVITPWVSNAPDAIRSLGALSEFLVKPPLIYRGLGKDFGGTLLLYLKYNDNQGKLGWIESLVGELPLEIIIEKQGGKMNILEFLKNGNGIHIKKKNRGKFTSYCGGKVTDECILKGKHSSNPSIRKRATFAANARKWKHKDGGIIRKMQTAAGGPIERIPEVIITPDKNTKILGNNIRGIIKDPVLRNNFYKYILDSDDYRDVPYISDNEKILRFINLYKKSGSPKIHVISPHSRPYYLPFINNIYASTSYYGNEEDNANIVSELSHAYQYNNNYAKQLKLKPGIIRGLKQDINRIFNEDEAYNKVGNIEYDAHSIIEPAMYEYISGSTDNFEKYLKNFTNEVRNYPKYYSSGVDKFASYYKKGGIIKALEGTNTSKWLKFGNTLNKVGNFMSNSGLGDFLLSGILTISSNNVADGNLLILNASLEMEKNEKKLMIPYYAKLLALLSLGPIDPENSNATKGVPADIAIPKFMSMLNGQIDQEYNNKKAINNMQTLLLKNQNTENWLSIGSNFLMNNLGKIGLYLGNKLLANDNSTQ